MPSDPTQPATPPHNESQADLTTGSDESIQDQETDGIRLLTWTALLGRWTDFARSALALPQEGDAGRVRQSVVSIVTLQAITHALGEVDLLDDLERAVALDRAEILIRQHAAEIHSVWRGEELPGEIQLLVGDARRALRIVRSLGVEWRLMDERFVARHPGELVMALTTMVDLGVQDLYLPSPGTTLFASSPVAFARLSGGVEEQSGAWAIIESFLNVSLERETGVIPRQVYRQFDFGEGGPVRDVVMPMNITIEKDESDDAGLVSVPAGQPLLIPAILGGVEQPVPLPPRTKGKKMDALPVVIEDQDS